MTPSQQAILDILGLIRDAHAHNNPPDSWFYKGPADLLLREGQWYDALSNGDVVYFEDSLPNACFRNAALYAISHPGCRYVEGYAFSIFPMHHGWVVNRRGQILEVSWSQLGSAYFGIPFRPLMVKHGSVLFHERNLAIYKRRLRTLKNPRGVAC